MLVQSAHIFLCDVPLLQPFVISRGAVHSFINVVLALEGESGHVGWGEAVPVSLSEDPREFFRILGENLVPAVLKQRIDDIPSVIKDLLPLCRGNEAALTAVDQALWDLTGREQNTSVSSLLKGDPKAPILIDYTIGALPLEATVQRAREVIEMGYGGVVVKITCKDVEADVIRVREVCRALPQGTSVRVDANGGFDRDSACRFIERVADLPIAFLEQPVPAKDLDGMKFCRGRGLAIAADETLKLPEDAERLVAAEACDVLNVKVTKAGGICQSLTVASIAERAGLPLVIGGGLTYGISRFASQHIAAASTATRGICHQGPGPASQALSGDITVPRLKPEMMRGSGGAVIAPAGPGLGFELDRAALAQYTIQERKL